MSGEFKYFVIVSNVESRRKLNCIPCVSQLLHEAELDTRDFDELVAMLDESDGDSDGFLTRNGFVGGKEGQNEEHR
jgi:hypothetical protein